MNDADAETVCRLTSVTVASIVAREGRPRTVSPSGSRSGEAARGVERVDAAGGDLHRCGFSSPDSSYHQPVSPR